MIKNDVFKNSKVKRTINYTAQDFQYRLYLVQTVLKRTNLDCLLIINGFFGENNKESTKFTNWFLKGFSGHSLFYNLYEDVAFEESIIVVTQDGLGMYLEPKAMNLMREKILGVKNCRVFVPDKEQFNDK